MPGDHHRHAGPEVRPAGQPLPAEDVDRDEDRLEEEEDPLDRESEPEDLAEAAHELRPQQAQLERQHGAGDRADGERHRRDLRPALRQPQRAVVARAAARCSWRSGSSPGRPTPRQARTMWNPSVNAIWLRAAPRSAANGKRSVHRTACGPEAARLDARELALDHRALRARRSGRPIQSMSTPTRRPSLPPEVVEVHAEVGEEGQPAGELQAPDLADRPAAADDRQRALVEVAGTASRRPARRARDRLGDVVRLLDRHRRQAGQRLAAGPGQAARCRRSPRSPDGPGNVRSGLTSIRPPRSVSAPGGPREHLGQRHGVHAGRPDHGAAGDPLGGSAAARSSTPCARSRWHARPRARSRPSARELAAPPSPTATR